MHNSMEPYIYILFSFQLLLYNTQTMCVCVCTCVCVCYIKILSGSAYVYASKEYFVVNNTYVGVYTGLNKNSKSNMVFEILPTIT